MVATKVNYKSKYVAMDVFIPNIPIKLYKHAADVEIQLLDTSLYLSMKKAKELRDKLNVILGD